MCDMYLLLFPFCYDFYYEEKFPKYQRRNQGRNSKNRPYNWQKNMDNNKKANNS